ncbi:MAG: proline racemase family protein [Alphaproteobacteria bacterium]
MPKVAIETVEMHAGGEPVRIVTAGYPPVMGASLLEKRRYAREHLDHLRRMLIFEPRGHRDMYGVIPVEPDDERADLAVLFMHNEGYSTMCGHAVIALGRWAIDSGIVAPAGDPTPVRIQCPCGLVTARVAVGTSADGKMLTGDVSFESVPAFAHTIDAALDVPGYGKVSLDIAYGGAFYAVLPAASLGLDVRTSPIRELVDAGDAVTREVTRKLPVEHPDDPDLGFVYGTILTDGGAGLSHEEASANVCIFADRQVDRSPTGSGATARVALMAARGIIEPGQSVYFESITRAVFVARGLARGKLGKHETLSVEVTGRAHYTGTARFTAEPDDMLAGGFLLR